METRVVMNQKGMVKTMELVRSIGASICVTIIVTGIFSILVPGKSMEKIMQLAVGLFFLSSVVLPIANGDWKQIMNWEKESIQVEIPDLKETINVRVGALSEESLEKQIVSMLQTKKIRPKQVDVTVHIGEDNSITITEILIILPHKEILNAPLVEQMITENLGFKPTLELERNG